VAHERVGQQHIQGVQNQRLDPAGRVLLVLGEHRVCHVDDAASAHYSRVAELTGGRRVPVRAIVLPRAVEVRHDSLCQHLATIRRHLEAAQVHDVLRRGQPAADVSRGQDEIRRVGRLTDQTHPQSRERKGIALRRQAGVSRSEHAAAAIDVGLQPGRERRGAGDYVRQNDHPIW